MIRRSLIISAVLKIISALTVEETDRMRKDAMPHFLECATWHGLTKEQVLGAQKGNLDPCFYACFLKKFGIMNEKGMFDAEAVRFKNRLYTNDEDFLKKVNDIAEECSSVNNERVTDGTNGCDRADLLVKCLVKHKSKIISFT